MTAAVEAPPCKVGKPRAPSTPAVVRLLGELDKLGTPEAIAGFLHDLGVRGVSDSLSCPVARWLQHRTGDADIEVFTEHLTVNTSGDGCPPFVCELPGPVVEFIDQFDANKFPKLHEVAE